MSQIECQVASISELTPVVFKVELTPSEAVTFKAGQYVLVHMGEDDKRPFSIASAPFDGNRIELHIGADENNTYAGQVLERMRTDGKITISGGHGEAYWQPDGEHAILIAGGTGFSYTYSILQQALADDANTAISLYWGARHVEDLYLFAELTALAAKHPHFEFIPVVEFAHDDWTGRTGWVHHAVVADYPTFAGQQVYIAGRFEMAKTARDDFFARGLAKDSLFGDAYAFI